MNVVPGLRVVRGPDWEWGQQDGGAGHVGTVAFVKESPEAGKAVVVQWDMGNRCNYRCGIAEKYDLRVFDNGPAGLKHPSVVCDVCRENGITGIRWKCVRCYDFDLCTHCYNSGRHNLEHEFSRIETLDGPRSRVPPRLGSKTMSAKGIFPSAEVVRGHDWLWGDQDGGLGNTGVVHHIQKCEHDTVTYRSVADVVWKNGRKKNVYRVGLKGKVDVKCTQPGDGGYYYPDHLPVLGAPYVPPPRPPSPPPPPTPAPCPKPQEFSTGDRVRVQLEVEIFKMMQEGHGGWNDQMVEAMSEIGTVQTILDSGDLRIHYPSNRLWTINSNAVTKVPQFSAGDVVRILDDIATVHNLQEGHGGWVDDMALALGQVGRVVRVFPTGDVRVAVNGRTWTFNPLTMTQAPGENPPDPPPTDFESEDIGLHLKLLSLLENPAVIVAAAAAGDAGTLRDFLRNHPKEVNSKAAGRAAIHCATMAGNVPVIEVLLEFNADLEVEDEDGDKPLHLCAYSDEDEAAKLLVDAGANVNSKNLRAATPLIIAAVKGHYSVLRILANHPNIQLHEQDSDGDTALHCAVLAQKNESVSVLLEAGSDPTLLNFRLCTPIHEAAKIGFLPAVEHFIRKFPQHTNLKKDDGYTPLHLAALNDHLDVVTVLADLDICDVSSRANRKETALHLAVHQGNTRIVERLVGYGIDLNAQDSDGDTALHIALIRDSVDSLSSDTPQLRKVRENFGIVGDGSSTHGGATVACFLVQEGANMYVQNQKGHTPLQLCSPDIAALVTTFAGRKGYNSFHGSLKTPSGVEFPVQRAAPFVQLMQGGGKGLTFGGSPKPQHPPSAATAGTASESDGPGVCFLCEAAVDVRFEPCGHALMCSQCAQRAKKCPTCKKPVKTVSKLKEICVMCKEEEGSVTVRPCGHKYCPGCARRPIKECFECRGAIEDKEGLPPQLITSAVPEGDTPNCPICLTEPKDTAFLCGHQLCWECAQRVDHCPVCRKFVTHRIRLFQ